ncbi:ABC transporter ATP-binding protein [Actinacidiphila bryophytorum]|uniref:ABC transporter ATP-binding protein n=1 Tax=Actinacidiphila bryophytorum TaxID=1436133 RepID=UPI002176D3DB|nr:ABC transporter ATP-binding protein [Actinacidiphila bryophytorum]UWE08635.1 ABC transporter ATP-binding protein/permease [Actinacidiphila bryophytorum]
MTAPRSTTEQPTSRRTDGGPVRTALPTASPRQTRAYAWSVVRAHSGRIAAAAGLSAGAALASLAVPELLGRITGMMTGHTTPREVYLLVAVIATAVLVQTVLTWWSGRITHVTGELVLSRVRDDFLAHALDLPLATVERAGTGDLLTRATLDARVVDQSLRTAVPKLLTNLITLVVLLAGAVVTAPLLVAPVAVVLPILLPVGRWYIKRSPTAFSAVQARLADLSATVAETADGAETMEALGWQQRRIQRTEQEIERAWAAQSDTLRLRTVFFPVMDAVVFLPCLTTLVLGGLLVRHGDMSVSQVVAAALLMQMLTAPAAGLVFNIELMQLGNASLARLVGAISAAPERVSHPGRAVPAAEGEPAIELRGVRFGYEPGRAVLHGVDLDIRPGERLALVGPTGAGKSTLGRLIAGIHPPDEGTVSAGGRPLAALDVEQLRRLVVMTVQEQHIFTGTLADNLRLAAPGASAERLRQVLADVSALEWADALPDGTQALVGGGRRALPPARVQQVALARLLLADPRCVILDEATSMLSPTLARDIEAVLGRVLAGRAVVSIAHRLETAQDADRIAVMDRGRIVELGCHDELLAHDGLYAALWRQQTTAG